MMRLARILSLSLLAMLSAASAARAECTTITYPFKPILNPSKPWGLSRTDTGVVINGFVTLDPGYSNRQGVDLSSNNVANYDMLKSCGTEFAFLRADNRFVNHQAALQQRGIMTFPYFYFAIPKQLRVANVYKGLGSSNQDDIDALMVKFAAIGASQAVDLETKLGKLGMHGIPSVSFAGISGQIMALDVEEKIFDEANSTKLSRSYFGRFYARAVCSFLAKVRENHPELKPVIYTTPSTFGDYLNYAYPQDDACLHGLPVWLARTTSDGGDLIQNTGSALDLYAQRLCLQSGGNRCIVHQYSHRALLGQKPPLNEAPHMDVDRLFLAKVVKDGLNQQFVRSGQ